MRVSIQEYRAKLKHYLECGEIVEIEKHGQVIADVIPRKLRKTVQKSETVQKSVAGSVQNQVTPAGRIPLDQSVGF